jgi:hypothetical protein
MTAIAELTGYPLGLSVDQPHCQVIDVIYRAEPVDRGGGGFKGPTMFLGLGMAIRTGQVEHSRYIAMLDPNVASLIEALREHHGGQDARLYRRLGITRQDSDTWAALTFLELTGDGHTSLQFGTAPAKGGWTECASVLLDAGERSMLTNSLVAALAKS